MLIEWDLVSRVLHQTISVFFGILPKAKHHLGVEGRSSSCGRIPQGLRSQEKVISTLNAQLNVVQFTLNRCMLRLGL